MYSESYLLMLPALQNLALCERQCCLIHIEQAWAEGRILHERVHEQESESRGDVYIVRGLKLRSLALGLSGVADVAVMSSTCNKRSLKKEIFFRTFAAGFAETNP
jgi:CRISPR-associated exonuclease Cas4